MHICSSKFGLASIFTCLGMLRAANSLNLLALALALALGQSLIYTVQPCLLMYKHCNVFFVQLAALFNFLYHF